MVNIWMSLAGLLWSIAGLVSVSNGGSLLPYIPIGMMFGVLGLTMD